MLRRWPIVYAVAFVTLAAFAQVVVDPYIDGDLIVAGQVRNPAGQVYLFDAPSNGTTYGRKDGGWVSIAGVTNGTISDAAADGVGYVRRNNAWVQSDYNFLANRPTTSTAAGFTDVATDAELGAHAAAVSGVHGITAFSATLLDETSAVAWRTVLGLGAAAVRNVGTGSTEVAAGNHTHSGYEATGTAAAAIAAHEAAADPHSQYQTQTETDARYLKLTGGQMSGGIIVGNGPNGRATIINGDSTHPGYLEFLTGDGIRRGFIGWSDGSNNLQFFGQNGWGWTFNQVPTVAGSTIWHAGNDGTGSGLDADLLDGLSSAYFLDRANGTGQLDASLVGGGIVNNTEYAYLDGVTSSIQGQLNGKANTSHGHNATDIGAGTVNNTEFGYLDGVTSPIQAQINALVSGTPTIGIADVTGLSAALDDRLHKDSTLQSVESAVSFLGTVSMHLAGPPATATHFPVFVSSPITGEAQVYGATVAQFKTALGTMTPSAHGHLAADIGSGTVDNTEFSYLDGVTGPIQSALNSKLSVSGGSTSGTYTHTGTQRQLGPFQPQLTVTTSNAVYVPIFLGTPGSGTSDMLARSASGLRSDIGAAAASHTHAIGDLPVAASGEVSATKLVRADDSRLSGGGSGPLLVASFDLNNKAVAGSTANVTVTANTSPLYYTVTHNLGNSGTAILLTCKTDSYGVPATACVATVTPNAFQVVISASNLDSIKRVYITIF